MQPGPAMAPGARPSASRRRFLEELLELLLLLDELVYSAASQLQVRSNSRSCCRQRLASEYFVRKWAILARARWISETPERDARLPS